MARISPVWGSMATMAPLRRLQGLFGGHLDVEVDGEAEVLAGHGELLAEVANLLAVAVDDDVVRAVGAAEEAS